MTGPKNRRHGDLHKMGDTGISASYIDDGV
jgi:hypothetical protein